MAQQMKTYNKGDIVLIKKGTTVYLGDGKTRIAGRTYTVTVHREASAFRVSAHLAVSDRDYRAKLAPQQITELETLRDTDFETFSNTWIELTPARVVWAGSGCYWHEANVSDVETVSFDRS
jgi:ribosomal protein L21E